MSQEPENAVAPDYGSAPESAPAPTDEMSAPAQMGPLARVGNVFFSPGEVFEDVRRSPRDWWLPLVLFIVVATAVGYVAQKRLDFTPEAMANAAIEGALEQQGKTMKDLSDQERQGVEAQKKGMMFFFKLGPVITVVFVLILIGLATLTYWVLLLIAQSKTTFFRVLSVVSYAYFVPNVLKAILQGVYAFLTNPDNIDIKTVMQTGGFITASPAAFVSIKDHPVLWTFLSYFDVFSIWFLALLAIGFTAITVKRMKIGTATIVAAAPYVVVMLIACGFKLLTAR